MTWTIEGGAAGRLSTAESETAGGTWDKLDKTTSPVQETDLVYQGSNSISAKVGTSIDGVDFDDGAAITGVGRTFMYKLIASNYRVLNNLGANGIVIRIGSSASNYYEYYVAGADTYPVIGGWIIVPIDVNVVAHRANLVGSAPTLTAINYHGFASSFTTTAKTENFAVDAIDMVINGEGVEASGSTVEDFDGMVAVDEGTSSNRQGLVTTKEGVIFVFSQIRWGTTASTIDLTDSNKVIIFPDGLFDAGFSGFTITLGGGETLDVQDSVFKGRGKSGHKILFDTISDVDPTPDDITFTDHGFVTADEVLYSKEGGTDAVGLTDATAYYVIKTTDNTFGVATTKSNALAGTRIALSDGSTGEEHSFLRRPSTLPVYIGTWTAGTDTATWTGCSWIGFEDITLDTLHSFINCILIDIGSITQASGVFTGCKFSGGVTLPGTALLVSNGDTDDISNCTFTAPTRAGRGGHAIEYNGTPTASFTFTGNKFNSYGPDRAQFLTSSSGIDDVLNDITTASPHGFTDGDVFYYNKEGGTAAIGLTDGGRYYLSVLGASQFSVHLTEEDALTNTNKISLNTSGTETHSFYSGNAAIYNSNSSGTLTLTLAGGGDTPTVRNAPGATTNIVTASVTTTISVKDNTGANLENARVLVRAASGGSEPVNETVTISRTTTVATVTHTGHGFSTTDKVQIKGITDKKEDNAIQTIVTVPDANTYTYTTTDSGSTSYTGTIKATAVFISGLTNASGQVTDTRPFATDQPINGFIRKSSASPRFKTFDFTGNTIDSASGLTLTVRMVLDEST
jgi:hypothetical protein